jgi:2-hydroxy-3-oxopropionate reductase
MSAGPLHSGMMDFIKAYAIEGIPDKLAFSIMNAAKDVGYYAGMAEDLGAPSAIAAGTRQVLENAKAKGMGNRMVPEIVDSF